VDAPCKAAPRQESLHAENGHWHKVITGKIGGHFDRAKIDFFFYGPPNKLLNI
jgi:hypothetical protein